MIIKEKDALSFRCCGPSDCGKKDPHEPTKRYCIGYNCMAWRRATKDNFGYCGLADRPTEDFT